MLLSVQSPLQYCASQPLDQIKVTALSAYQTRIENLSLLLTRDGGDVSFRYVCCRLPWSWVHAELDHRFFHPWRADGIDAEASRHLKRSSAHEAFQPGVDQRDGRASGQLHPSIRACIAGVHSAEWTINARTVSSQSPGRATRIDPAIAAASAVAELVSPSVAKFFRSIMGREKLQVVDRFAGRNAVMGEVAAFEHDIRFDRPLPIPGD